jgi:type VI secretion system protein ImpF
MAELTPFEKLQPSLLDRLTDDDPSSKVEASEKRWISARRLREVVIRDLEWLLNAGNFATTDPLDEYPEIAASTLNYGIPNLGGTMLSSVDVGEMARKIKQAILLFEPRILRHTLEVHGQIEADSMSHNSVTFEISADIWGQPAPFHMTAKTELELETGQVTITDYGG